MKGPKPGNRIGHQPAAAKKKSEKPNPFEIKRSKTKFETLGRRLKGASKNVIKAREDSVNKRKNTLLVEYKQLRKANTFVDRRFGENDSSLTEDDRSFAKLQTQRLKTSKRLAGGGKKIKFALGGDGDDGIALTHDGRSIMGDADDLLGAPELDDIEDDIAEEMMKDYNFGGGEGDDAVAKGPDGKPKSRKEVMEEIIAKSKAYKAMKQKQKEEDEDAMEKLDADYRQLLSTRALAAYVKPKGFTKDNKIKSDNKDDVDYDVAARELAFEGKGAASDRTLTAEEASERDRQRLELMEKERVKRMRGGAVNDDDEDVPGVSGPKGGFAARRAKAQAAAQGGIKRRDDDGHAGGDDDGDGFNSGSGGDDVSEGSDDDVADGEPTSLEQRRMSRAAGSHPLQSALRKIASGIAEKHGLGKIHNPMLSSEDEGGEDEDNEDEEGDEDDAEEDEDVSGDQGTLVEYSGSEDDGDGEEDDGDAYEDELRALQEDRLRPREAPSTSGGGTAMPRAPAAPAVRKKRGLEAEDALQGPLDLPYTIPVPETYEDFSRLVEGRPPDELVLVVERIRAFNSSTLASDSKRKLQCLYGILIQHFSNLSGETPIPSAHLDAMVPLLLLTTAEVPFYAATVARARLARLNERLTSALSGAEPPPLPKKQQMLITGDGPGGGVKQHQKAQAALGSAAVPAAPAPSSPWPGPRALMQLKLFSTLFPSSDRRHPVTTPAMLLIGRALSQCVAADVGEAVRGLALASLALHMAAPAKRYMPEPPAFLADLIVSFVPPSSAFGAPGKAASSAAAAGKASAANRPVSGARQRTVVPGLLAFKAQGKALAKVQPSQVSLMKSITLPAGPASGPPYPSAAQGDDGFKLGLLRIALHAAARSAELCSEHPDAYDLTTRGLRSALSALGAHKGIELPPELELLRKDVLGKMVKTAEASLSARVPLARKAPSGGASAAAAAAAVRREFNPRFEEGYTKGRDYDPDRERAEQRKLKRQVGKEKRGALRELRKDAAFMADARDRERALVDAERTESQRRFYSELQAQAADLNSGGQGGINIHLKKAFKRKDR